LNPQTNGLTNFKIILALYIKPYAARTVYLDGGDRNHLFFGQRLLDMDLDIVYFEKFWAVLHHATKYSVLQGETCHGAKHNKGCLNVLLGASIKHSKQLPLLVVSTAQMPYFKHLKSLPCTYTSKKSAQMMCAIFEDYMSSGCHSRKQNGKVVVPLCC
jgi:hypothetical protein